LDYFKQRRAYRNFKMYEASVSNGQNNLYRELLDYANDEGKLDVQFRMKNSALLSLTGLSEPGLDKARNSLVQLGLIKYVKGKKNVKPPEYKIANLYSRSTGYPTSNPTRKDKSRPAGLDGVGQPVGKPAGQQVGHKELTLTDPDLTGTDIDDEEAATREDVINSWTSLWGFPNAIARPEIDEWLSSLRPDVVNYAIQIAGEHDVQARGALKYLRTVISGWHKRKITTLDQAKQAAKEHDERMANGRKPSGRGRPAGRKEIVPKWAEKGASQTGSKPSSNNQVTDEQRQELADRLAKL